MTLRFSHVIAALAATLWMSMAPASGQTVSALDGYDLSSGEGRAVPLPHILREISGLAVTPDGRLFAHQDERASIKELDPRSGSVIKSFAVGRVALRGDFEGMAIVGERFFLITSEGTLIEFRESPSGRPTGYEGYNLRLGRACEIEGLAYDPATDSLLIPCKTPRRKAVEDHIVVFSVPLETMAPDTEPRVFLPLDDLDDAGFGDDFNPSAIEIHPETGSILLLAARQEMIIELDPSGGILNGEEFRRRDHPQPEGIAILPDGTLVIADEGQNGAGRLTLYSPQPGGSRS